MDGTNFNENWAPYSDLIKTNVNEDEQTQTEMSQDNTEILQNNQDKNTVAITVLVIILVLTSVTFIAFPSIYIIKHVLLKKKRGIIISNVKKKP